MHAFLDLLARPLRWLFQWLLALIVLFEEWGWEPLARLMAQLAQLPLIGWLERRIARLPPALALGVFLAPGLMLLPVKLAALALVSHGHVTVNGRLAPGIKASMARSMRTCTAYAPNTG